MTTPTLTRSQCSRRTGVAVAVAAVVTGTAVGCSSAGGRARPAPADVPTGTAHVVRTTVVERQQVSGTLGYGDTAPVLAQAAGTLTWAPTPGSIIRRGERLFELDGSPVVLLYGTRPAWRTLSFGVTDGADVRELERNLVALGADPAHAITVDRHFSSATAAAVRRWQTRRGLPATGTIPFGQVNFAPHAVRVATRSAPLATSLQQGAPVLTTTGTRPVVSVAVDAGSLAIRRGDPVLVTLPGDNHTVTGRITSVSRVATAATGGDNGGGGAAPATIAVTATLTGAIGSGSLDQAPVQVAVTAAQARDVLAVPVTALLATPAGGYDIDVRTEGHTTPLAVTLGLFDDNTGLVEVNGAGLTAGAAVQVAAG